MSYTSYNKEQLHDRYLPGNEAVFHTEIAELLRTHGFLVKVDAGAISKVEWESQEQDFALLDWFLTQVSVALLSVEATYDLVQGFSVQLSSIVAELDARMVFENQELASSYQRLNDPQLEVSSAHKGSTPYQHIKEVFNKLQLADYIQKFQNPSEQAAAVIQITMAVFLHDWGKMVIAQGDAYQFHAEISYLLSREWYHSLQEKGELEVLFPNEAGLNATQQLQSVRYHHIFELLDRGVLTPTEVRALVPDSLAFSALSLLSAADSESVSQYKKYTFGSISDTLLSLTSEELNLPETIFLLKQLANWLLHLLTNLELNEQETVEYLARKSANLKEWVAALPEKLQQLFAQVVLQLPEVISV